MLYPLLFLKSQFSTGHVISRGGAGNFLFLLIGINKYLLNMNRVQGSDLISGDTKVRGHFRVCRNNNSEFFEGKD